jgi:excisionase family DNA binding protein
MYDSVMEEHLTVEEVASRLKFSTPTVRRLLRTGELAGVKFGPRQWRIPESSVRAYVEHNTRKPATSETSPPKEGDRQKFGD